MGNIWGERDTGTEAECNFPTDAPVSCSQGSRWGSSTPSEAGSPGRLSNLLCRPQEAERETPKVDRGGGDGPRLAMCRM